MGRPIVSVVSLATGDPFLATIDTGFNGAMITSAFDAPRLGVQLSDQQIEVELGDSRLVALRVGRIKLLWLGQQCEIDILISDEPPRGGEGRPMALIGAELLMPHLLMVDYGAKTVDIEAQD